MIVFIVRIGPADDTADQTAKETLEHWRSQYTLLVDSIPVQQWRSPDNQIRCHWTAHNPDHLGGTTYTATTPERFALFSGRPVLWTDTDDADGRTAIDPHTYLNNPDTWSTRLDGRFAIVHINHQTAHLQTDAAGFHPVYAAHRGNTTWISNIAALVTPPNPGYHQRAAAAVLAAGWSFTGEPLAAGVDRLTDGTLHTYQPDGTHTTKTIFTVNQEHFTAKPDYHQAARDLVAISRGLADWPHRPRYLSITGGLDSRLIAAAMRKGGVLTAGETIAFAGMAGYPDTRDVVIARELSGRLGIDHRVLPIDESTTLVSDFGKFVATARLTSPGTTAVNYMQSLMIEAPRLPVPVNHDGAGGEVARASLGHHPEATTVGEMAEALFRFVVPHQPAPLIHDAAVELLRQYFRDFTTEQLDNGIDLHDVPDVMMFHRASTEHGPSATNFEYSEDAVSAITSHRMWPHIFGQPREDRKAERFHYDILQILGADLMDLPIHSSRYAVQDAEASARAEYDAGSDPITNVHRATLDAMANQPDHGVWDLLERSRVDALMKADPTQLSSGARHQLWRLATVFCGD
jgi:hypothetical protein